MNPERILAGTAAMFLALGDQTRLRLLNLMRDREICVSNFTGTLGHSQPLISRHLAYLRSSGLVEARRDGKWMHYSIAHDLDENTSRLLSELFKWMEDQDGLRSDRNKYRATFAPDESSEPAPAPRRTPSRSPRLAAKPKAKASRRSTRVKEEAEPAVIAPQPIEEDYSNYEPDEPEYRQVRHNELEDFLL